ncbi:GFA family protein [Vibrio viridaestus]|uniref:GFA family protein n=1 Tax=Vibrio viridaestus TaxID=2487322 RepID=A0A3N9TKJ9_9VIBR|nr:GFA family protein [Vibrio viridaestus]RQW64373.1 GFA family protein [Vibrio viridaestus]
MVTKHSGSCLCGTVHFEIEGDFDSFYLCHCKHCQKDTGSDHGANLFSQSAKLTWLQGHEAVKTYQLPNTRHAKAFCSNCGSALPNSEKPFGFLVVPAGCLDSALHQTPNAHLYAGSRAPWSQHLEAIPSFWTVPNAED